MKTRVFRLTVSLLMATVLAATSCGPKAATAPAPTPAPVPAPAPKAAPAPVTTPPPTASPLPVAEKPKYGGTISVIVPSFLDKFDIGAAPG